MRVLLLNPSGQLGGAETSLLNLLAGMRRLRPGWEFVLLLGEHGPVEDAARSLDVPVRVLPFPQALAVSGESGGSVQLTGRVAAVGAAARYLASLRREIRQIKPDVLQTNGIKMHLLGAVAKSSRLPAICHIHDYISSRRLTRHVMRAAAGRFRTIVANSADVARDCAQWAGRVPVVPIHNAVDLQRFTPAGPRADLDAGCGWDASRGCLRIGLIATFARWKGHLTFLRAIARLPVDLPARFYVIGGPIYQTSGSQHTVEELREEAERLGIARRVGFTGFIQDTPAAIRALDIVVHASTRPEPFGMVIIEAMACGRAIAIARAGGAAELYEEGVSAAGHAPGDDADLARVLENLARDPQLRSRLGAQGRQLCVHRFGIDRMAQEFVALYESLGLGNPMVKEPVEPHAATVLQ